MQNARALLHLFAARVVLASRMLMLDHGIADDQPDMGGDRQQAIFERPAIQKQRMILSTCAGNELVHDAAARADKLILRALAGERDGFERQGNAGKLQQGQRCGYLNRCGGA
jgi:hypothetical protein